MHPRSLEMISGLSCWPIQPENQLSWYQTLLCGKILGSTKQHANQLQETPGAFDLAWRRGKKSDVMAVFTTNISKHTYLEWGIASLWWNVLIALSKSILLQVCINQKPINHNKQGQKSKIDQQQSAVYTCALWLCISSLDKQCCKSKGLRPFQQLNLHYAGICF